MEKTRSGITTPGGRPVERLENPSSEEAGPTDSGEGQLLLGNDFYKRSAVDTRSSLTGAENATDRIESENEEFRNKLSKIELLFIQLSKKVTALKEENRALKKALNIEKRGKKEINSIVESQVYYTDEEGLSRETDWVLKKKKTI